MSLAIRPLNRDDREEVRAWHELVTRSIRVQRPDFEPRTLDEMMANLRHPQPGITDRQLVGYEDGRLVGSVEIWDFGGSDSDKAMLDVQVDPPLRRRGYGHVLAEAGHAQLAPERTTLLAEANFHGEDWSATPDGRFARSLGYDAASLSTVRELPWPADAAGLDRLEPRPDGYTLATYVDGIPEALRPSFGTLVALTEVDAPSGELEWGGDPMTPAAYQQELDRVLAGGAHMVETVATRDDDVVALTTCVLPANPRRPIDVGVTYVHREHRGHRLGLAVKVAIERELLRLELSNPSIRTSNADDNSWMIAVNEELGFRPVLRCAELMRRR